MDDLGAPTSYLALQRGIDVFDVAGERLGVVEHVLADEGTDIFDGLIVDTRLGFGGWRFADADQVEELYERGVVLKVPGSELHDPERSPGVLDVELADGRGNALTDRLRRAWDYISGNY